MLVSTADQFQFFLDGGKVETTPFVGIGPDKPCAGDDPNICTGYSFSGSYTIMNDPSDDFAHGDKMIMDAVFSWKDVEGAIDPKKDFEVGLLFSTDDSEYSMEKVTYKRWATRPKDLPKLEKNGWPWQFFQSQELCVLGGE